MTFLITGGAGFIGSHLVDELLKHKQQVIILDDLSTGSFENIEHCKNNKKLSYVIDSVLNEEIVEVS